MFPECVTLVTLGFNREHKGSVLNQSHRIYTSEVICAHGVCGRYQIPPNTVNVTNQLRHAESSQTVKWPGLGFLSNALTVNTPGCFAMIWTNCGSGCACRHQKVLLQQPFGPRLGVRTLGWSPCCLAHCMDPCAPPHPTAWMMSPLFSYILKAQNGIRGP